MPKNKEWIKELRSWVANSRSHKLFCERQIKFWTKMLASANKQLDVEEKWLEEAIAANSQAEKAVT